MHWPLTLQDAEIAYHRGTAQGGLLAEFGPLVAAYPPATLPELVDTGWFDGSRPPALEEWEGFESFCAAHGLPCLVRVQSVGLPLLLPDLTERGYRLDYLLHAYMQALPELRGDEQPRIPSGIEVQETADREGWAQVAAAGFGPGTEEVMRLVSHQAGRLFWARRVGMGEWAASAAYTVSGGVATFHGTATQPAERGQGLQTALLAARLRAAQSEGGAGAQYASVYVEPGSGSERNVQRAGFRLVGAQLAFTKSLDAAPLTLARPVR